MKKPLVNTALLLLVCLAFGAGVGLYTSGDYSPETRTKPEIRGLLWPEPRGIGSFELVDHQGEVFQRDDLSGKWSLLFFGYTHCPDVCPTTLAKMNQIYKQLRQDGHAENLQVLFTSVDPERDIPAKLSEYVNYFNPEFIGLGGSEQQVDSLTGQMGVVSVRTEGSSPDNYLVDHTASVFIIDPEARWVGILSAPHDVTDMTERYLAIKQFISQQG